MPEQHVPDGCPLTPVQFDVLRQLANGHSYEQIAARTGRAVSTVRSHANAIHRALGSTNATQAVALMYRNGWMHWTPPEPAPDKWALARTDPVLHAYNHVFDEHLRTGQNARTARALGLLLEAQRALKEPQHA